MHIGGTCFGHLEISFRKWRSHSASSPHLSNTINSNSIVDLAITVCFEDFHETACNTPNYTVDSFISCLGYNKSKYIFFRNKIMLKK